MDTTNLHTELSDKLISEMSLEHKTPGATRPEPHAELQVTYEKVPLELRGYSQWICWRYVDRGQGRKPDKPPVNPRNLATAGVHWANTWTTFEQAYTTYLRHCRQQVHGVGFVLTPQDPYVAVDLDNCVHEDGIESTAAQIVHELGSYTEISPSGHGIRVLLACPGFHDNARREVIEVYSHSRYVTVTGHHVSGTPASISVAPPDVIAALVPPVPEQASSPHHQASRQEHLSLIF